MVVKTMSHDASEAGTRSVNDGPVPPPAELFCIHSYAGEAGQPCGWRGVSLEVRRSAITGTRRCPRCGRTTLLEIPRPPAASA